MLVLRRYIHTVPYALQSGVLELFDKKVMRLFGLSVVATHFITVLSVRQYRAATITFPPPRYVSHPHLGTRDVGHADMLRQFVTSVVPWTWKASNFGSAIVLGRPRLGSDRVFHCSVTVRPPIFLGGPGRPVLCG